MEEVAMGAGRVRISLAAIVVMTTFAACGGASAGSHIGSDTFPLTLSTSNGAVSISHRPTRIISLSASATQDLYAVGAGTQVVAVDSYSSYPPSAPRTSLSGFQPNVEAIANYRPDLVVASDNTNGLAGQLNKLGVPLLVEPPAADLNGVYAQMAQIGRATGHSAEAATAVSQLKQQVRSILGSAPHVGHQLSVYHELDQTYYSATSSSFVGQIYKLLDLKDIADAAPGSNPYPQLSSEFISSANPDLIVLADTDCCQQNLATVQTRPGWSSIKAVRSGDVLPVHDEIASEWGPRITLFIQAIVDELKKVPAQAT
jgi:iron complex transport system substrate-binding protein